MSGAAFAASAAGFVGTPFRLHGRHRESGVDCVGLVGLALRGCGRAAVIPEGYALRALSVAPLLGFARRNGFVPLSGDAPGAAGDLLLCRPSPVQFHLAVALPGNRLVHAHAGLGRVAIESGSPPWPVVARWRLSEKS